MPRPDSNSQQVFNVSASRKPWLARLVVTVVDKDITCADHEPECHEKNGILFSRSRSQCGLI